MPRSVSLICSASSLFVDFCDGGSEGTACFCDILISAEVKKKISATETVVKLQTTYEKTSKNKTKVHGWFPCFRNKDLSLEDKPLQDDQ